MRILITGGAGFIGSNLVHYLLESDPSELGCEVTLVVTLDKLTYAGNLDNLSSLEGDSRHVFVRGDIADQALVAELLRNHQIDAVMHLAAESHVDRSIDNPDAFIATNIVGTYRLLEEFRRYLDEITGAGGGVAGSLDQSGSPRRFLHVSTDEVYGSLGPGDPAFSETTPYAPNSPYSASKAASDHLARSYHHTYGLPVVTTNCSNNYGPYQFPEKLIPLMIRKTIKGESLPVYGDGGNVRDWLFVEDHCRGLVLALLKGRPGEVYNLGGNCEMKNLDVVRMLIETVDRLDPETALKPAGERIAFVKDRPGHDRRYAIDSSKILRELGWAPREDFASGLAKTVQWYLDHEDWVQSIESGSYRGERLGLVS